MKLVVVGFGQCGGRIADEFARLNKRAHGLRGLDIITGAYAVNTDVADMSGLVTIKPDFDHRILIGNKKTQGHGVGCAGPGDDDVALALVQQPDRGGQLSRQSIRQAGHRDTLGTDDARCELHDPGVIHASSPVASRRSPSRSPAP